MCVDCFITFRQGRPMLADIGDDTIRYLYRTIRNSEQLVHRFAPAGSIACRGDDVGIIYNKVAFHDLLHNSCFKHLLHTEVFQP